jgi:hypothetical protein
MSFDVVKLAEVASFIMGQAPPGKSVNVLGQGTPFYRSGEFGQQRPLLQAWTTKPLRLSNASHVWVCVVGANAGEVNRGADGAIGRSVAAVVPGSSVDSQFLFYCLKNSEPWLRNRSAGSVQAVLSKNDLGELEIPLPSLAEQKAIAATLGALDEKIQSNRRISSRSTDLAIATLSGQGHPLRVGDVAELSKGLSYKGAGLSAKNDLHSIPLFSLSSFTREGQLSASNLKFYSGEFKSKHELQPWELLIANTDLTPEREILGRGIIIPEKYSGAIHTHHTTAVRFKSNSNFALLLWAQLQTATFRNRAEGFATGTTVASLPPEAILDFQMTVPLDAEIRMKEAKKLLRISWQAAEENETLAKMRDALMPALLSGRIILSEGAT